MVGFGKGNGPALGTERVEESSSIIPTVTFETVRSKVGPGLAAN